jgi:hypothetical protein
VSEESVHQEVKGVGNIFSGSGSIQIEKVYIEGRATAEEKRELERLRRQVENVWVKGVLERSPFIRVLIELGKETRNDLLENPWSRVLAVRDRKPQILPGQTKIRDVYNENRFALLILGSPGSGKTTTLLDLTRSLIAAADTEDEPTPVVLNLSTWTRDRAPLTQWLGRELPVRYPRLAVNCRAWLQHGRLTLLLDGLDEVPEEHRAACVRAINNYELPLPGLVVCCRMDEYIVLSNRLNLNAAICLQPLSAEQIDNFLAKTGLEELRKLAREDSNWRELLQTPFRLSIACSTWNDLKFRSSLSGLEGLETLKQRQAVLFDRYIDTMFERRGHQTSVFPKEKTLRWLGWLARRMNERSASEFLIEQLQPDLLPRGIWRWSYAVASWLPTILLLLLLLSFGDRDPSFQIVITWALAVGSICIVLEGAVLVDWIKPPELTLVARILIGIPVVSLALLRRSIPELHWAPIDDVYKMLLPFGLLVYAWILVGLRTAPRGIRLMTQSYWSFKVAWITCVSLWGILGSLSYFYPAFVEFISFHHNPWLYTLFTGIEMGFLFGLLFPPPSSKGGIAKPNSGFRSSLVAALCLWFSASVMSFGNHNNIMFAVAWGLPFALGFCGQDIVRHAVLRVFLAWNGSSPIRYVRLLEQAVNLAFIQRVGGAYLFIHKTFRDHVAEKYG